MKTTIAGLAAGLILLSAGSHHQVVRWIPPISVTTAEIHRAVGELKADWNGRVSQYLPGFALSDDHATAEVTVADSGPAWSRRH